MHQNTSEQKAKEKLSENEKWRVILCVCVYICILTHSKTHGERNIASDSKKKSKEGRGE